MWDDAAPLKGPRGGHRRGDSKAAPGRLLRPVAARVRIRSADETVGGHRVRLVAVALASLCLSACGRPPLAPREVARREVLAAVLDALYVEPGTRVLVIDDDLSPDLGYAKDTPPRPDRAADAVTLPDGTWMYRPTLEGLAPETFADWLAHAARVPAPRDLAASRPIEWFTEASSRAIEPVVITPDGPAGESPAWMGFHHRYPGSSGLVHLSDVGFSPRGDQAVLQASSLAGGLAGSGWWVLLRRQGGHWVVVVKKRTWVA